MRCEEALALMPAYLEKDLLQDKIEEIKKHLASCPSCREKYEQLERNKALLSLERDRFFSPPRALLDKVNSQIKEERERMAKRGKAIKSSFLAFLGLAIGILALRWRRKKI